jgi:hypothetical protein
MCNVSRGIVLSLLLRGRWINRGLLPVVSLRFTTG